MFFIGVFGIQDKEQNIGTCNNIICPSCGRLSRYVIYKSFRYFHLFFIPIFRWNMKYIVKTSCCSCLYELDPIVGKEFEKNSGIEIKVENLQQVSTYPPIKYCSNCNSNVSAKYNYCPYCGEKLM